MPDPEDIPSPIDLRDPADATVWAREADIKRPWRAQIRDAIAELLGAAHARTVLELGPGPGFLAERVLLSVDVERYVLFDFSQPMLEMSRERVGHHPAVELALGDFKQPGWTNALAAPFDAVVTMQAAHELRHKRHLPTLYRQVHTLVRPGGVFLVSDHTPFDETPRSTALLATEAEQHAALRGAGFSHVETVLVVHGLYVCLARRN